MALRPGVEIVTQAGRTPKGEITPTGAWMVTALAEMGPIGTALTVENFDDLQSLYGARVSYSNLYDAAETFFSEGGATMHVSRVGGPTPVKAFKILVDRAATPLSTLRVEALNAGDYGNRLGITVENGTVTNTVNVAILFDGVEKERKDGLANPAEVVTAFTGSEWVTVTNLASVTAAPNNNPALVTNTLMATGTDDRSNATITQHVTALSKFTRDLGPAQVSMLGQTTQVAHEAILAHCATLNGIRVGYMDERDLATKAQLIAAVDQIDQRADSIHGGLFGAWVEIPPLVGARRYVPGSAFAAGVTARQESAGSIADAPAGAQGVAQFAIDTRIPSPAFSDQDYHDLNAAGVNMIRNRRIYGTLLYGYRSVTNDADWVQLQQARIRMAITTDLEDIAEKYVFRTIDSNGLLFGELEGEIAGALGEYLEDGLLYSPTGEPEDAYSVDTGPSINTPATVADGQIKAVVQARFGQFAELVTISITKVAIQGALT